VGVIPGGGSLSHIIGGVIKLYSKFGGRPLGDEKGEITLPQTSLACAAHTNLKGPAGHLSILSLTRSFHHVLSRSLHRRSFAFPVCLLPGDLFHDSHSCKLFHMNARANVQGPGNGGTVEYVSGNTCIMDRLFSIVPTGLYTLTATVSGVPHVFTTEVPGTFPAGASDFFYATWKDVTIGTVNTEVQYVPPPPPPGHDTNHSLSHMSRRRSLEM
jgi:hypothetical protein